MVLHGFLIISVSIASVIKLAVLIILFRPCGGVNSFNLYANPTWLYVLSRSDSEQKQAIPTFSSYLNSVCRRAESEC